MIYEPMPDDLGFLAEDTELGKILTNTFRHSWFRAEYVLWNISGPGDVALTQQVSNGVSIDTTTTGATPIAGLTSGVQFPRTVNSLAEDPTTVTTVSGTSQVPTLKDFGINNLNGFRGTYGLPLPVGSIELSGYVIGASTSRRDDGIGIPGSLIQPEIVANPAPVIGTGIGSNGLPATNGQSATFLSQGLLVNGVRVAGSETSSAIIDYDISYHAALTTSVWGTEGNYVFDNPDPNAMFQVRPTMGIRYLSFQDKLLQSGQYTDSTQTTPSIVNRQINSNAHNNLVGPQIGIRTEFVQPWFTLGFEPKFMAAINTWQSALDTVNVISASDPGQSLLQRGTTFSPTVDLKAYSNIQISKYLSAYIAYNFIWTGSLNRSYNDIVYNKSSATGDSNFSLQKVYNTATLQGLAFGFQLSY